MKKILLFIAICIVANTSVMAKDYAKIQLKEMEKAQKYNTTDKYFYDAEAKMEKKVSNIEIKDPKLIHLGGYQPISADKLKEKTAQDNLKYEKIQKSLNSRKVDSYNAQAYMDDYYRLYRIAERLIRANNLNYMSWIFSFQNDKTFNAHSYQNAVTINTGAYDTFCYNDDALALLLGHELAHALLGHSARDAEYARMMQRAEMLNSPLGYGIAKRRYLSASKKMEYAADAEGAKLAARAGFDLSNAKDLISQMASFDDGYEYMETHPTAKHRLENYAVARKYFMVDEWKKQGVYNIYNSEVLPIKISSDRKSMSIGTGATKSREGAYQIESVSDVYTRQAYNSYINGEFNKAEEYFQKLLSFDKNNPIAYLYLSYTEECLYKQTGKEKYLENAKAFASYAQKLAPDNSYIKAQVDSL